MKRSRGQEVVETRALARRADGLARAPHRRRLHRRAFPAPAHDQGVPVAAVRDQGVQRRDPLAHAIVGRRRGGGAGGGVEDEVLGLGPKQAQEGVEIDHRLIGQAVQRAVAHGRQDVRQRQPPCRIAGVEGLGPVEGARQRAPLDPRLIAPAARLGAAIDGIVRLQLGDALARIVDIGGVAAEGVVLGIEQAGIDPRQARDAVLQGDVEQGRGRVGPGRDEHQFGRGLIEARPRERAPQRQAARAVGPPVEPGLRRRDGLFDRKSVELNPAGGAADQALPQAQLVVVLLEVGQRQAQRQLGRRPRLQLPHQAVAVDGVGVGLPVDQGAGRRGGEGRRRHGVGRHKAFLVAAAAAVVGAQQQAQAVAFAQGGGNETVKAEIGAVVDRAAMASPRGAGGIRSSHGRAGDRVQAWAGQRRAQPQVQGAADDVAVDVGRAS
ncbi:hypothetical protein D3C80_778640 [compost metagenome]